MYRIMPIILKKHGFNIDDKAELERKNREKAYEVYSILQTSFTALPVVTALIVRKITGVESKSKLSLKVWKDYKM